MAVGSVAAMSGNSYFSQAVKEYAAKVKPQDASKESAGGKTIAEFSDKEWDKLLERVDGYIEDYREDLAQRKEEALEKQKERAKGGISWQRPMQEWIGQAAMQGEGACRRHFVEPAPDTPSGNEEGSDAIPLHVVTQYVSDEALQKILGDRREAPYAVMADSTGKISFQGVEFQCDFENNRLCLGDVSNPQDCLTIPLEGGGCLVVNRDSIDALAGCIGMFSPGDINRILRAISQDAKLHKMKYEIEEETSGATLLGQQQKSGGTALPERKEEIKHESQR